MVQYQQAYRPVQVRLAQSEAPPLVPLVSPNPPLTSGQRNAAVVLGGAQTAFGVAAALVGARAGMRESGLYSTLGWAVAVGGGLFAGINLLGTLGMVSRQ